MIELSNAFEARVGSDLRDGEVGLIEQVSREVDPPRAGDSHGCYAPRCSRNSRRRCREPRPTRSASASTSLTSSAPSEISLRARETTADVPSHAGVPGEVCGRHRRQGRKPAASADPADGYHRTSAGFLNGTEQIGRQYTPVVSTPAKTRPSKRRSRL